MAESEEDQRASWKKNERKKWNSWLKTQHSEKEDHGIQSIIS